MKITIITVCFNSETTIKDTLESIKHQDYTNIEYIIIDGGSTDNTLKILDEYRGIITVLVSEQDKGLYDAMNKGIALATGDIIGMLNSDDVFINDRVLEKVAKFHLNNNVDASVGNIVQFNELGRTVRKYSSKNWNPEKLKIGFMPPHPAVFFKKKLFDKFGKYHLDFIIGADYELITRFFLNHEISWKFSNITTTAMLIGGLSSSGLRSYLIISKEIRKALVMNNVNFSYFKIQLRGFWKVIEFF